MKIQENLYLYKTLNIWEDILSKIKEYNWLKSILNTSIKLDSIVNIPSKLIIEKNIYWVRVIPFFYFNDWVDFIDVPSILLECGNCDMLWNINYLTDDVFIKAKFNSKNPWYFVEEFKISYKYLTNLLKWFKLNIQLSENVEFNPTQEKKDYLNSIWFKIFKDWIYDNESIKKWKNIYKIIFESISINNIINTLNRTPFFTIKYPIYKEMLLTSFVLKTDDVDNYNKITWITYDDYFYKKNWVPVNRAIVMNLKFSWSF